LKEEWALEGVKVFDNLGKFKVFSLSYASTDALRASCFAIVSRKPYLNLFRNRKTFSSRALSSSFFLLIILSI
jgi:hypothetical protein